MSNGVVQVVDSSGEFTDTAEWFNEDANLGAEVLTIVAVLGPQASGKSTLCNSALGTSFAIAPRGAVGRATTRGIAAAKAEGVPTTLVLDIEGCDARSRGRAGKAFQARCASLATSLADVIVLNFWYHDIGRLDATGYVLLETVFAEAVRAGADGADVGSGAGDDGGAGGEPSFQSALVFAVRDVDDDVDRDHLHEMLLGDAVELWESFGASSSLEDYFSVSTFAFPHMRHRPDEFKTSCEEFGSKLSGHSSDSSLRQTKFSKGVPADSCVVFARGIWDSFSPSAARGARGAGADGDQGVGGRGGAGAGDDADAGEDSLVAAYRCNEAFSEALQTASAKISEYAQTLEDGDKIDGLGSKMRDVLADALDMYDDGAEGFVDEPIHARKRRELESVLETSLHSLFLKQIQLIRESALSHFKSATTSEDMPSDFAFFTADSLFSREAEESKRPGSGWSYNNERTDLQNMMQEISTQRKRLLASQVTAAQQHANAMQYLQVQQAHMQAMQQQSFGGSAGQWNIGAAYRPPDTNINASLSYQQGRTNIQISMVPDESASLLGPNGFTAGVGPGNLGLSFNINV